MSMASMSSPIRSRAELDLGTFQDNKAALKYSAQEAPSRVMTHRLRCPKLFLACGLVWGNAHQTVFSVLLSIP